MSPEAIAVAVGAMEDELQEALGWLKAAEANVAGAAELQEQAALSASDAAERVEHVREALTYLQALKSADAGAGDVSDGDPLTARYEVAGEE